MRFRVVALAFVTLLASAVANARPRASVRDELPDKARLAWDTAAKFFEVQQYEGAVVEYENAYEASKNPRVLYNVGVCQKELHHYARAIMTFRRALLDGADQLTPDEAKNIVAAIQILEGYTTTVEVRTNEAGAAVFIDDYPVGVTPLPQPVPVDPGEAVVVRLRKDGFTEGKQTLRVEPRKVAVVDVPLVREELKTKVSVHVLGPTTTTITIDGKDVGQGSFDGDLPAGKYSFQGTAAGFVTFRQSAEVVYGVPLNLTLTMLAERHEGLLYVTASPAGAVIEIDGKLKAETAWEGKLDTHGGHELVVRKSGYATSKTEVGLADDQVRHLEVSLVRDNRDWIWWASGAAAVVAGGAVLGYFLFRPTQPAPVYGTFAINPIGTSVKLP